MNTKFFASALIAAAAFAAAPSFAGDNISGEVGYVPPAPVASNSGLTREAVRAEVVQAVRNDALPATGEGSDVGFVASGESTLTRAEVHAQAVQAVQNGEQIGGE